MEASGNPLRPPPQEAVPLPPSDPLHPRRCSHVHTLQEGLPCSHYGMPPLRCVIWEFITSPLGKQYMWYQQWCHS